MPTKTPLRDTIFFRWEQDWGNTFGLQYSSHSLLSITSSKIFCGLKGVVIHRFQFDKAEFVNTVVMYTLNDFTTATVNTTTATTSATSATAITWWRHQMETFSALLALFAGNSPVTGEFPAQRPVTRCFDVFFDLRLNRQLSKQWDAGDFRRYRAHFYVIIMANAAATNWYVAYPIGWKKNARLPDESALLINTKQGVCQEEHLFWTW